MTTLFQPKTIQVDGLSVRYAEDGQDGPDAILMSPWPESIYAFEPAWPHLAVASHLVAIDPPGFGGSDYRQSLMNPKAMGQFILKLADALGLDSPHIVGPDIGTSSVLFAAAADPDRFRSIVIGSGGAAVPLDVTGVLKEWIEAPNLEPYRRIGGRKIVEIVLGTIAGYTPSDKIREDYMSCYEGDRFADTIPYAQSYREYLPELAKLLPRIETPVRIVAGADDPVVPRSNAEFLHERLPNARVDLIAGAGHFCWEEKPAEYAALITNWWYRANAASKSLNQLTRELGA
jgi:pimeloyl-ACP methyl ester carboxylesterase